MLDIKEAAKIGRLIQDRHHTFVAAMQSYAERMDAAAAEAEAAYRAGQADPTVKADQDCSVMTNNGYKQYAENFRQSADNARTLMHDIDEVLWAGND